MLDALPPTPLAGDGPLTSLVRRVAPEAKDLRDAARLVRDLPYGRPRGPGLGAILEEGCGTCSSKHVFLAALARELGVTLELRLGIFAMTGENTEGVGPVLTAHGLRSVPEAHCTLVVRGGAQDGARLDVTFPASSGACALRFDEEHVLAAEEVAARKPSIHRAYLRRWAAERGLDADAVWAVREACIAALGTGSR